MSMKSMPLRWIQFAALSALLCAAAIASDGHSQKNHLPRGVQQLHSETIHNFFSIEDKVFSGSTPDSEAGFEELADRGVKTIISVDGGKPEVDLARKFGITYIHLPIGYDGTSETNLLRIIRAVELADGPIFMHCHHGEHRGPAAVAWVCEALQGWSTNQAVAWLKAAGTSSNYPKLYEQTANFKVPTREQLNAVPADFPETATVSGLVDAMVEIDNRWNHLKGVQEAGYTTPKDHPDLVPSQEAVLLMEGYRELARTDEAKNLGDDFIQHLQAAEKNAQEIHAFLKGSDKDRIDRSRADTLWSIASKACSTCHKHYRN